MNPEEQYLDVLQNIEAVVVATWVAHPEMTDYSVLRVYEAAIARYKTMARGGIPKPETMTGLDAELYAAVQGCCEWRLGGEAAAPRSDAGDQPEPPPIPVEDLVACLRRLRKSVERWNRTGGSRGYLEFVSQFSP